MILRLGLFNGLNSKLALLDGSEELPSIPEHYDTKASTNEYGHVKVTNGNGLSISNGVIKMNEGSSSSKGALQVSTGNGLSVTNGIIKMGQGNASTIGSVKLSDTYTSSVSSGNAAGGLGASQNALYNAYNTLNTKITNGIKIDSYDEDTSSLYLVDM